MNRAVIGVGVGLGLGALALGGIVYTAVDRQRRRRAMREQSERIATWEEEGGALREHGASDPTVDAARFGAVRPAAGGA
jgi:hypothetical protein